MNNSLLDLVFLSVFPNLWQAPISSDCILTPVSDKIKETIFSNWLSGILNHFFYHTSQQGLPICFPKYYIFALSLSFSSCNRLITISFRLIISSFKLLIQLTIFPSSFTSASWLEALSLSETLSCQCLVLQSCSIPKNKNFKTNWIQNKSPLISVISATDSSYLSINYFLSF